MTVGAAVGSRDSAPAHQAAPQLALPQPPPTYDGSKSGPNPNVGDECLKIRVATSQVSSSEGWIALDGAEPGCSLKLCVVFCDKDDSIHLVLVSDPETITKAVDRLRLHLPRWVSVGQHAMMRKMPQHTEAFVNLADQEKAASVLKDNDCVDLRVSA